MNYVITIEPGTAGLKPALESIRREGQARMAVFGLPKEALRDRPPRSEGQARMAVFGLPKEALRDRPPRIKPATPR